MLWLRRGRDQQVKETCNSVKCFVCGREMREGTELKDEAGELLLDEAGNVRRSRTR